ncbi:aromatic acid/H+ symport family MFS transporter [Prauserella halophila]|uniref:Aromatic acid/H+ symport family MFS transporter n=1 Tax=Prauserella halophila TaxID=185641 RepID=A0ABN1WFQ4_9PSEU|nr:MFS transporter [Prauserella halophila]MCP2238170.1 MFS transporter, AAHS family, 4-hydroxybenzoate transporter [Prauserella halophila]
MNNEVRPDPARSNTGRLGRAQVGITVLCALVVLIDGFDTQAIALVAPDIAAEWQVPTATFGVVFGVGLLGGAIGAIIFGWAGDRFGRKPTVLFAVALLGVASSLTPLAGSVGELTFLRLVTGFGLGGALPGVIAITSEYTPQRLRTAVVSMMYCGFPLGAVLGGLITVRMVPALGWQSVFVLGGAAPLLLLPILAIWLPESARFLAVKGSTARLNKVLRRTGLDAPPEAEDTGSTEHSSVVRLFTDGRATGTLLIWTALFLSLLMSYLLINWLPLLARQAGLSSTTATFGVVLLNLGSIIGTIVIGRLTIRSRPAVVVGTAFALGAVAITGIAFSQQSGTWMLVAALFAGGLSIGAQISSLGICVNLYDTSVRATGVGWAVGIGRVGGIVGPVVGGLLIGVGISTPNLFLVTALASLLAAAAILGIARRRATTTDHPAAQPTKATER